MPPSTTGKIQEWSFIKYEIAVQLAVKIREHTFLKTKLSLQIFLKTCFSKIARKQPSLYHGRPELVKPQTFARKDPPLRWQAPTPGVGGTPQKIQA